MILIHLHWVAIILLAVVTFLSDNLRGKRAVPLTKQSGTACLKTVVAHRCKIAGIHHYKLYSLLFTVHLDNL